VPYFVIEPDPTRAAQLVGDDVSVVAGENDSGATYERLEAGTARLVLANCADTTNTNITLTVREVAPDVPIVAIVEEEESRDVLKLAGRRTSCRSSTSSASTSPTASTWAAPRRTSSARSATCRSRSCRRAGRCFGGNGAWHAAARAHRAERRRVLGTRPPAAGVPPDGDPARQRVVVAGTAPQVARSTRCCRRAQTPVVPVLVIGAGKVGQAARGAQAQGLPVHVIDRDAGALDSLATEVDRVFSGDAADRRLLERAGIDRRRRCCSRPTTTR
jgi:voltage-gated potassium channel